MPDRLPLFPLGTVLFPGEVLPLRVFEPRYRSLVQDLLALPEPARRFGVVAIREGREVGDDGVRALHAVGCTAVVQEVETGADGTYELLTVGRDRFALRGLAHDRPYLVGGVDWLPDGLGDAPEAAVLAASVEQAWSAYLAALASAGAGIAGLPRLPDDPLARSHAVAATVLLDLDERQGLLEAPDATARLRAELRLLRREAVLVAALRAVPSPAFRQGSGAPQ